MQNESINSNLTGPLKRLFVFVRLSIGVLLLTLAFWGCTKPVTHLPDFKQQSIFVTKGDSRLHRYAPIFVIEKPGNDYNLIGTPTAAKKDNGEELIFIDSSEPSLYAEARSFNTDKGGYQNLIYRIHFKEVPARHLNSGKNVGLIVVVTLNQKDEPVLVTTVHTCGCYLAIIPTSYLTDDALPKGWDRASRQSIYGESLPSNLEFHENDLSEEKLTLLLEDGTHRVKNVWVQSPRELTGILPKDMALEPLSALNRLVSDSGQTTSFFETEGARNGLVKGSYKPWERLLISWWSMDWHVGEDKKLGADTKDGRPFYTSLKPWARNSSDMRDFKRFIKYWGWGL